MKTLITAQQVIDLAFSNFDKVTANTIKEQKIIAAQEEYLRPVLNGVYLSLLEGKHEQFLNDRILPALAYFVRYISIPDMSVQINNAGANTTYTPNSNVATDKQRETVRMQALKDANALLSIAVRYIEDHPEEFTEYTHKNNQKRKGSIIAGIYIGS